MEYFDILGVNVTATNLDLACHTIEDWIREKKKTYICIAPVATIVDCQRDLEYRKVVNNSGMTTPDGMPLVWTGKMKGNKNIGRTYGPDLLEAFSLLSQEKGYKHYFYGGTKETNELLIKELQNRFPKLDIAGYYAPPFRKTNESEEDYVLEQINKANPDVLWIGLGSPKQDFWMYSHRDKLNVPVMIGVGAAFDFIAGTKRQAPLWMQRNGLEWFFRLCSEPRRLWKRYLIGNTTFLWLLFCDWIKNLFSTKKV